MSDIVRVTIETDGLDPRVRGTPEHSPALRSQRSVALGAVMGAIRRSRNRRPPHGGQCLTARDPGTFLAPIGRMQFVTASQVCRLTGLAPSTVTARLASLHAQSYLHVYVPVLNGPNYYALSDRGREVLIGMGYEGEDLFTLRALPRPNPHLVAVNWIRIALTVACRTRSDVRIESFLADHDLRRFAAKSGRQTPVFVPDALVDLHRTDGSRLGLVFEYDAHEETRRQFESKAKTTVERWQRGQDIWGLEPPWRPVLVAETGARLRTLAEPIVRHGGGTLWLAAEKPHLVADPLGPVLTTIDRVAATPKTKPIEYRASLAPDAKRVR